MKPSNNVVAMNPLADAECELAEYFESAYGSVGFRAQNPNPDRFGGVWDEEAIDRLHRSRLRRSHAEAVDRGRLVEMTLSLVPVAERYTLALGFERRGYAYATELGAARLWQAFRRQASNVGLLGIVLQVADIADRLVVTRVRADEAYSLEREPSTGELLAFLEETAAAAFDRWDSKRAPGSGLKDNTDAWMVWLPKWFTQAKHAADRRLVAALRAYEDVRQERLGWEEARADVRRKQSRGKLEQRFDRMRALMGGRR